QNIIIGSLSGISYLRFAARLAPVAAIGLAIDFAVVATVYRRALAASGVHPPPADLPRPRVHRGLLAKSVVVTLATVGLFFAGFPIALVALGAAGVLLLGRVRPEKVYSAIDWPLLVMFCGLFVVVHAFEVHVVHTWGLERWHAVLRSPVVMVSLLSVGLSNLVSNVPAVLLFQPLMEGMPGGSPDVAWLALAVSGPPDGARMGGEADRRGDRPPGRDGAGVCRVPEGGHPGDAGDDAGGRGVAGLGPVLSEG